MASGKYDRIAAIDFETHMGTYIDGKATSSPFRDRTLMTAIATKVGSEVTSKVITSNEEAMRHEVMELMNDPKTLVLMHNVGFDYRWALGKWGNRPDWKPSCGIWDTLIIERALTAGSNRANSLKAVAQRRLNVIMDKSQRKAIASSKGKVWSEAELDYARLDAETLLPIYEQQRAEIAKAQMQNVAYIENQISVIAAEAQHSGIDFNVPRFHEIRAEAKKQVFYLSSQILRTLDVEVEEDLWDDDAPLKAHINLSSNDQVVKALNNFGINIRANDYYTKRDWWLAHKNKASDDQLNVIRWLIDWTFWDKLLSWHYPDFCDPVTKRIHAMINTYGADTSRMSMGNPNLQQTSNAKPDFSMRFGYDDGKLGLSYRECFVADPDIAITSTDSEHVLITADLSQIEYFVLADQSNERWMIDAMTAKEDFHKLRASQALRVDIEEVNKAQRQLGKTINFGLGFGGSYLVLQRMAKEDGVILSTTEAKDITERVKHSQPNVRAWIEDRVKEAERTNYLRTAVGHRRFIPANKRSPTRCANTPVQGTAGGMLKQGAINIKRKLGNDGQMVLFVHDEIVTRVRREHAEEIAREIIVPGMVTGASMYLEHLQARADYVISPAWAKA
ncbi:MAG: DNA polymerase [Gammaproteobacteria bacterium]|nr:DNA polymerase [Gammaproteobacteria bacterium]